MLTPRLYFNYFNYSLVVIIWIYKLPCRRVILLPSKMSIPTRKKPTIPTSPKERVTGSVSIAKTSTIHSERCATGVKHKADMKTKPVQFIPIITTRKSKALFNKFISRIFPSKKQTNPYQPIPMAWKSTNSAAKISKTIAIWAINAFRRLKKRRL